GAVLGTPGYMAPEQARGNDEIDPRADVFALGCVLFECLTGSPAFPGDHFMAILAKILFHAPPRAREIRPDVPADLDALAALMLSKDPDARPCDGAAVAEAFGARDDARSSRPSAKSGRFAALTGVERRALCVVLIAAVRGSDGSDTASIGDSVEIPVEDAI